MIQYRNASFDDYPEIAKLHATNWSQNYRGIFSDEYLDHLVEQDRMAVWEKRRSDPPANQHIITVKSEGILCGFACLYVGDDPIWGTFLDNLHVDAARQGQGIGAELIKAAARWSYRQDPKAGFYLFVLEKNTGARRFYERLGAVNQEMINEELPDGGRANIFRYVWKDVRVLIKA